MKNELIFAVDENDNPLPPLERKEVISKGLWRRACGGMVIDRINQRVLCQKRSDAVDQRPGLWVAIFGGKSVPGEVPIRTAQRELREELGLDVKQSDFIFYQKSKSDSRKQFEYFYWVEWSGEASEINFGPEEISDAAWHDAAEAVELLRYDNEWYSYGYDIAMIEEIGTKKKAL
jgi:8-oxo-dGTP pyrophosphatase MutT (NUDIX family)